MFKGARNGLFQENIIVIDIHYTKRKLIFTYMQL